jgi:hypothetical protein
MRISSSTSWLLFVVTPTIVVQGQPFEPFDYGGCPPPTPCAAPPEGCNYILPEPDANGCIVGCGKLFCDPKDDCPVFSCAPPPDEEDGKICTYGNPHFDLITGCPSGCGTFSCGCQDLVCMAPGPGCSYGPRVLNGFGCPISCGELTCDIPPPALPVCPVCDNDPCARVRCGFGTRCVARPPRRKYDRRGCPKCVTSARCVVRRPYLRQL